MAPIYEITWLHSTKSANIFIPQLVEFYMKGEFPIDKLVKMYDFDDINKAAEDSTKGVTVKPIIRIGQS